MKKLALTLAIALTGSVAVAQEADDTTNCIFLPGLDSTEVVDASTILFYMNNGTIYRNVLPHRCPGLEFDETFLYRVPTNQLCSVDVITVLTPMGRGFMPGPSCGLGKFQSISEEAAEEIKVAAEQAADID